MGTHATGIALSFQGAGGTEEPAPIPGFRHFLGDPAPSQRFRVYGVAPDASADALERLRDLMSRLSRRMDADIEWPPHDQPPSLASALRKVWENPYIPSGYTYLLQLVSHDLVQSSMPLSLIADISPAARNMRRSGLKLDTIYGSGPVGCPFAYALDDRGDRSRTKLRLGRIQRDDRTIDDRCPFRDIARATAENQTGIDRGGPGRPALTDALLVDPRNDDHAILSQMTALFALLHNGLVDLLTRSEPQMNARLSLEAAHRRYLCARGATTLIYRSVVRHDLMKRFLHPAIYEAYSVEAPEFLDEAADETPHWARNRKGEEGNWSVPLEFSHGIFRFGHALVRNQYRINDIATNELAENLQKTSLNDPINMPLNESWIVQWSQFFEIDGSRPNLSRRIGPKFSDALGSDQIFPAIDETNRVGLAYRDLISSSLVGLWSLDALIEKLRLRRPELIGLSPLLANRDLRVRRLAAWLAEEPAYGRLSKEDIATLSQDPPLPFFFLFEAAFEPEAEGLRLGVLGSILVAEVVFSALLRDPMRAEAGAESLADALRNLSLSLYGTNLFEAVPDIKTMSELIAFTAEIASLRNAEPAFV
ncbi:Animal haem peroxidase [Rhizobiales bacterium GAS191]|nr:Animal haem peroxidase [Rhizobiales bacterium GAS113]SED70122.1 Animal haem peroxidase [Rhizobiales bacterium GAS191]SEE72576.1 Animal haem peroxidase [Rhizobiales bacterium GAS188]